MPKIAATLRGIHNVKSLQSTGKRSIPATEKSAFLELFMLLNKKERLLQERVMLRGRREQVNEAVATISRNMAELLKVAVRSMKGGKAKDNSPASAGGKKHNGSTILEY